MRQYSIQKDNTYDFEIFFVKLNKVSKNQVQDKFEKFYYRIISNDFITVAVVLQSFVFLDCIDEKTRSEIKRSMTSIQEDYPSLVKEIVSFEAINPYFKYMLEEGKNCTPLAEN